MTSALRLPARRRAEPPRSARNERSDKVRSGTVARQGRAPLQGATRKAAGSEKGGPSRSRFRWLERIMILLGAGVVLAGALKGWIALESLPVQQITVTGELEHIRTNAIREMVEPQLVHGFIGTDLAELSQQLEALPWVYTASVRRVWPNSLEIHIDEQLPIARWGDNGFLNHQGQIFRPSNAARWESLPLLQGPDSGAPALMRTYQRLVDLLAPLGLGVKELVVDERGEVEAQLQGGQRLLIGGQDFLERIQRFGSVYRAELAEQMPRVERIDLRYAHGVAVAFAAPVEEATETAAGDAGNV
ncbi:cell division protein FtsQ/DivIB [Haliea sp. E17]|uniref:cell division protein FtsQ/DivIB n=1 Tax=Haliea sp. E17 TaxID=3401576 RepID=UPI003AAF666A